MISIAKTNRLYSVFFLLFLGIVGFLSFKVIEPLLNPIILGSIMAYLFYPVYCWLNKRIKYKSICALIVCIVILMISFGTIIVLGKAIALEAQGLYESTKNALSGSGWLVDCTKTQSWWCENFQFVRQYLEQPAVAKVVDEAAAGVSKFAFDSASEMLYAVPEFLVFIAITFFISFFLLKDGDRLAKRVRDLMPIKNSCKDVIIKKTSSLVRVVVFDSVLLAIVQGVFASIAFLFLGVPEPLLKGLMTSIASFVPYVGTALIWVPAVLGLLAKGVYLKAILLAIWGAAVVSSIDNLLKPFIISEKAKVHPMLVFVGVIGGMSFFGLMGFVIGPVILALFEALIEIYEAEKDELF